MIRTVVLGVLSSVAATVLCDALPRISLMLALVARNLVPRAVRDEVDPYADVCDAVHAIKEGSETRLSVLRLAGGALFLGVPRLLVHDLVVKVQVAILVWHAKVEVRCHRPELPALVPESAAAVPILRLWRGRRWREFVNTSQADHSSHAGAPIQATRRRLLLVDDAQTPHVRRRGALLGVACAALVLLGVWAGTLHLLPSTPRELAERQPTTTVAAVSAAPGHASGSNSTATERTAPPIAVPTLADDGSGFGFCLFFFLPFC